MAASDTVPALKAVIVGDNNVGKTSLLIKWFTGQFPEGYIPSVFEQEVKYVTVEGETLRLEVWETVNPGDYRSIRPLSYPGTNVFLICFAIDCVPSFQHVREVFSPEVKHYCPNTPVLLLGMKSDLRQSDQSGDSERVLVTQEQAIEMAKDINAVGYYETSSLGNTGVEEAMMAAASVGIVHLRSPKTRK